MKPALGMPTMPPLPASTTLVKFFNLDVDLGFFIFIKLDPYKTLTHMVNRSTFKQVRHEGEVSRA